MFQLRCLNHEDDDKSATVLRSRLANNGRDKAHLALCAVAQVEISARYTLKLSHPGPSFSRLIGFAVSRSHLLSALPIHKHRLHNTSMPWLWIHNGYR